ncbi:MAG: MFS transporter [Terriglobales bacterium]
MSDSTAHPANLNSSSVVTKPEPSRFYRWAVLAIISVAMFGNYYVYDCIAPVADLLATQLHFSDSAIGLLQAIYSIPNVFMVLVGGILVDKLGLRKSTLIFGALCTLGAVVTVTSPQLQVMAAGRLIFGLGAESLIVAITTGVAKWFRGKELSFAFGINLMIARFGSWLAQNSPTWAKGAYTNWRSPLLIAVAFGALCTIGPLIYWVMEVYAEKNYSLGRAGETDKVDLKEFSRDWKLRDPVWIVLVLALIAVAVYPKHDWTYFFWAVVTVVGTRLLITSRRMFGISYLYIVLLCITFYSAIFPFETFAIKFFIDAHHTSRELGGFLVSILTLFTMFGTPAFGLVADKIGRRTLLMITGSFLLIPVYLMMAYTSISLYVPMAMMGVAFSLVPAILWPSVAYIVPQAKLGTAYGLMTMIQNIGLAGFNLIIGWANDHSHAGADNPHGYAMGMWIFSALGLFAVFFSWLLRRNEMGPNSHGLETITAKSS